MKMRKKMFAMLLLSCMNLQALPVTAMAAAMPDNSGFLLAEEVQKNQEAEINDLTITGNSVTVNYQHNVAKALVIVAVYDSKTGQMFFSGNAEADKNKTSVTVTLNGTVPETYTARAFLLEQGTMRPLCPKYEITKKPAPEPDDGDDKILAAEPEQTHIVTGTLTDEDGSTYECQYVNNQIIVSAADNATQEQINALVGKDNGKIVGYITEVGYYQIELSTVSGDVDGLNQLIAKWKASPLVEDAYLNTVSEYSSDAVLFETSVYPNDDWEGADWSEGYPDGGNWGFEAIYAASAQQMVINDRGGLDKVPSVKVGVIDSCFDSKHNDLDYCDISYTNSKVSPDNVQKIAAEVPDDKESDKNNPDKVPPKKKLYSNYAHGTHVAGTIAAKYNNNSGISGIALKPELYCRELRNKPDWFGGAGGQEEATDSSWLEDIFSWQTYLARMIENGVKVINYSIGDGRISTNDLNNKAKKAGEEIEKYLKENYDFVIVTSAGNDPPSDALYNNCFTAIKESEHPNAYKRVIVVGATDYTTYPKYQFHYRDDYNYGSRIDVLAPGTAILSTVPANQYHSENRAYMVMSGTSMASPHVAGVAALVYEANPNLTGEEVKKLILDTADIPVEGEIRSSADGSTPPVSRKMVNAARAVAKALNKDYPAWGTDVSGKDGNGNKWSLKNGKLTVSGNQSIKKTATSKGKSEYYPWIRYLDKINSITIEEGITGIGVSAFAHMSNLKEVTLPESLTTIEAEAFWGCDALNSITIPKSVKEIGGLAFGDKQDGTLNESFTIYGYATDENGKKSAAKQYAEKNNIPFLELDKEIAYEFDEATGTLRFSGAGKMDDYGLYNSPPWVKEYGSKIKTVVIGNGITSVGNCAFYNCYGLTNITIPDSVISIGKDAFEKCSNLTGITIPDSVISIGQSAFWGCDNLTNIMLSNSVINIGDYAFYSCGSLSSITIPDSVINIGDYAFCHCRSLSSITIPDSVISIGKYMFQHCENLTSITLPNGITSISEGAFWDCSSLTNITIPDSVTIIQDCVFFGCSSLINITIPDSVTSIGAGTFEDCSSLISITIPDSVTSINWGTFNRCSSLTNIMIPDSVTDIGAAAFCSCRNLISITIPDGVTSIGSETFWGCSSLTNITIPNNVTIIDADAFYYCRSLISITIPNSVTNIGNRAFSGCGALKDVYYQGSQADWNKIRISEDNDSLKNATIHYNWSA